MVERPQYLCRCIERKAAGRPIIAVAVHADDILDGEAAMIDMDSARIRDQEAQTLQINMMFGEEA